MTQPWNSDFKVQSAQYPDGPVGEEDNKTLGWAVFNFRMFLTVDLSLE